MRFIVIIILSLFFLNCTTSNTSSVSKSGRLKVPRPGMGERLDKKLAELLNNDQRVQALKLCNDILFSSRSDTDRETAYHWRLIILAIEEVDNSHYKKAEEILNKEPWIIRSSTKKYYLSLLTILLKSLEEYKSKISREKFVDKKLESAIQLEEKNEKLKEELKSSKKQIKKLEKLLQDLEKLK